MQNFINLYVLKKLVNNKIKFYYVHSQFKLAQPVVHLRDDSHHRKETKWKQIWYVQILTSTLIILKFIIISSVLLVQPGIGATFIHFALSQLIYIWFILILSPISFFQRDSATEILKAVLIFAFHANGHHFLTAFISKSYKY